MNYFVSRNKYDIHLCKETNQSNEVGFYQKSTYKANVSLTKKEVKYIITLLSEQLQQGVIYLGHII
jgi:hypothetical protein